MKIYCSNINISSLLKQREECCDNCQWDEVNALDYQITKYYFNKLLGKDTYILTVFGGQYKYVKPVAIDGGNMIAITVDINDLRYGWSQESIDDILLDPWSAELDYVYHHFIIAVPLEAMTENEMREALAAVKS